MKGVAVAHLGERAEVKEDTHGQSSDKRFHGEEKHRDA